MSLQDRIDDTDFEVMTPCATCTHRSKDDPLDCKAFPNGIPDAILQGFHMHLSEFPGDTGIRYERR